ASILLYFECCIVGSTSTKLFLLLYAQIVIFIHDMINRSMRGNIMDWVTEPIHSMYMYLTGAELRIWIVKTILRIIVIVVMGYVVRYIGNKVIDAIFADRRHLPIQ